jgi:hypothetical protein
MPRYLRDAVVLVKPETTNGTDASPTGSANAMQVSDMTITPIDARNVDRDLIRPYLGGSEQLVVSGTVKCTFTVEVAGTGTAGGSPKWYDALLGCAAATATLATPARVEATPITNSQKAVSIYYYDSGVLHKIIGAMGSAKFSLKAGDRPKVAFEFTGLDGGISAATNATPDFSGYVVPPVMVKANVVDVTLGATYSAGALTGGTVYPSTGLEFDLANSVQYVQLLSTDRIDITQRAPTGSVQFDLTAAQEVSFMGTVKANTTQSCAITVGTTPGNKFIFFKPKVQLINPSKQELSGSRLIGYDMRIVPNTGNDEWRIVAL